jgi:hypothetical protein
MTRDELEHAIRAACDVADDTEIYVFDSQAILGQHPDPPEALRQSAEVDVMPKNKPDAVDRIDGALGELSQFHQTFGFYVHGVSLETAVLPEGWQDRLIKVCNENTRQCTGWCVEGHDLAASKLVAFRDKDRNFARVLLAEGLIEAATLAARIRALTVSPEVRERLTTWVTATCQELD